MKADATAATPTGFAVFDEAWRLLDANAAMFGDDGVDIAALRGKDRDTVFPEILSQFRRFDGETPAGRNWTRKERRRIAGRWSRSDAVPVEAETLDGAWKLLTTHPRPGGGIAFISADVSAMKRAQIDHEREKQRVAELAAARQMLGDAIESLDEGFALYDEDHRLVMCNSRYREMNYPAADIIKPGILWRELSSELARRGAYTDRIDDVDNWVDAQMTRGLKFVKDAELSLSNGETHAVSVHPTVLGGFVVTRTDVTERKRMMAAERNTNAMIHRVLDACPSPTRMSTIDGETLYRNPASMALYGERGTVIDYFVDPADRGRLVETLVADGGLDDFRCRQYTADGKVFLASISSRLIEFQGQQVIVSNTADLTDMAKAQEETRQANERLIDAIESLSEGFALYDRDDRLVLANSQYRKGHAMSADALLPGVKWLDFLRVTAERGQFPVEPDRIDDWLAERAKDRNQFRQGEFQHADGKWYLVTTSPTREGGFVVTRVDISARKKAEEAERAADALVRQVLEACPVNIQMTRAHDGKLIYRSPATADLFGEVESAVDYYADPAARDRYVERLLRDGRVDDLETTLIRKDGRPCLCSISSRVIDFRGEKVIVSHTYDLTDRIAMENEIERQRETLHQNEKLSALGELLAGVAHELNNPLSVVVGQSLMLKETASDAKTAERADRIGKAADRCARIVKTFLAMARQQPARTGNTTIDGIIEAALEVAGYAIRSSDIRLDLSIEPGLPPIWADPDQLSQVFINLLVNAEQALQGVSGIRRIKVAARLDRRRGEVVVKVADSGPGIPKEILPRIFEPFFTTKEVGAGTGIGLSFCNRIIVAHGGSIRAENPPEGGTAFFVRLPVSLQEGVAEEAVEEDGGGGGSLSALVVDDEEEVGDLIAEVLEGDGYQVTVARSGIEALRVIGRSRFDFVLSDLRMPDMDGQQLYRQLAATHPATLAALGFITGDTMSPGARAFLEESGRPYLEKPIKPNELRKLVQRLTETRD